MDSNKILFRGTSTPLDAQDSIKAGEVDLRAYIDPDILEFIDLEHSVAVIPDSSRSSGDEVEVDLADYDAATVYFEDNGCWSLTIADYEEKVQKTRHRDGKHYVEPYFHDGRRGVGSVKHAIVFFIKHIPFVRTAIKKTIEKVETRKLGQKGLLWVDEKGDTTVATPESLEVCKGQRRFLLLLHGTGSSTDGSFRSLFSYEAWKKIHAQYDGRVLAFNHLTLTQSVAQNVKDLLDGLDSVAAYAFDILSFSRGGLLGEILCGLSSAREVQAQDSYLSDCLMAVLGGDELPPHELHVGRHIRVGSPAYGTSLLSDDMDVYIQQMFKVLYRLGGGMSGFGGFVIGIEIFIQVVIEQRKEEEVLPGLENMRQKSNFQVAINAGIKTEDTLIAITGESKDSVLAYSVKKILGRWYGRVASDLVVDTASMTRGFIRKDKGWYKRIQGPEIHHLNYFKNPQARQYICAGILDDVAKIENEFSQIEEIESGLGTRGALVGMGKTRENKPYKQDRPYILFLPGILGSTFDYKDQFLWVHYIRLIFGGLPRILDMKHRDGDHVKVSGAVDDFYGDFLNYFDAEYHVEVFGFDWRDSMEKAGMQLAQKIDGLQLNGHKLYIVAHSQGGLVVKDLLTNHAEHNATIEKVLLLGVPWKGSYLIPQAYMGQGERFGQLRNLGMLSYSKRELQERFVALKGGVDLLPVDSKHHDFTDYNTWITIQNDLGIPVPTREEVDRFAAYVKGVESKLAKIPREKIIYIAGKADKTVERFSIEDNCVKFVHTAEGDGSVTWKSGIPKDVEVYYTDVKHGDLANKKHLFPYLKNLLLGGAVEEGVLYSDQDAFLQHAQRSLRGAGQGDADGWYKLTYYDTIEVQINTQLFDGEDRPSYGSEQPIRIRMLCGHLRYAAFPVAVGHFLRDAILSAEKEIDFQLDYALSIRNNLGVYPGKIGTSYYQEAEDEDFKGVLVVGLGRNPDFDRNKLEQAIYHSVMKYLIESKGIQEEKGISMLLIGSGYAGLTLEESITAIINGVKKANASFVSFHRIEGRGEVSGISTIEFVELYERKAENALSLIRSKEQDFNRQNISIENRIIRTEGRRRYMTFDESSGWWNNLTIRIGKSSKKISYTPSSKMARIERSMKKNTMHVVRRLFKGVGPSTHWEDTALEAAFSMLLTESIEAWFRNSTKVELRLNDETAAIPWELLRLNGNDTEPYSIKHQIIRKLEVENERGIYKLERPIHESDKRITIIANPKLSTRDASRDTYYFSDLPHAQEEGVHVKKVFSRASDWDVIPLINLDPLETLTHFELNNSKILHIACHGAYREGVGFELIMDYDLTITKETIKNARLPELVFLNCCFSATNYVYSEGGKLQDPGLEDGFRLAASAGLTFVKRGVRVAIVTAWEVDDQAAKVFAQKFYEEMLLSNRTAGDAFYAAKKEIYRRFPTSMTWAAYQFYGDPFYALQLTSKSDGDDYLYGCENDALADIEYWVQVASSARHRGIGKKKTIAYLDALHKRLKASNLDNARTLELLCKAYKEMDCFERALPIYHRIFEESDLSYSTQTVFSYKYSLLKSYVYRRREDPSFDPADIKSQKDWFDSLQEDFLSTKLLTYKASGLKSILYFELIKNEIPKKDVQKELKRISEIYLKLYEKNNKDVDKVNSIHGITSWIVFRALRPSRNLRADIANKGISINELETMFDNRRKFNHLKTFWNDIALVNIGHALLAVANQSKIKKYLDGIKNTYDKAWKRGGSLRQLRSEIEFISFICAVMEFEDPDSGRLVYDLPKYKVEAFKHLRNYYQSKYDDATSED